MMRVKGFFDSPLIFGFLFELPVVFDREIHGEPGEKGNCVGKKADQWVRNQVQPEYRHSKTNDTTAERRNENISSKE